MNNEYTKDDMVSLTPKGSAFTNLPMTKRNFKRKVTVLEAQTVQMMQKELDRLQDVYILSTNAFMFSDGDSNGKRLIAYVQHNEYE